MIFSGGQTRVLVQWGHCSQAVGADGVYYRLTGLLAGRPDVSVIAAGCDGACFAATQVIVESAAGERFFDHVSSDAGLSRIAAAVNGAGDAGSERPSPELEAFSRRSISR